MAAYLFADPMERIEVAHSPPCKREVCFVLGRTPENASLAHKSACKHPALINANWYYCIRLQASSIKGTFLHFNYDAMVIWVASEQYGSEKSDIEPGVSDSLLAFEPGFSSLIVDFETNIYSSQKRGDPSPWNLPKARAPTRASESEEPG